MELIQLKYNNQCWSHMNPIKNSLDLQSVGDVKARKVLLSIANETLSTLNSEYLIPTLMHLEEDILHVGERSWDLSQYSRIFVLGAGKAGNHMAVAVEKILGKRITKGIVIVKQLEEHQQLEYIDLLLGGHPYPNESGYQATLKILDLIDDCGPSDFILTVFSGGSSALMNCPAQGISIEDESILTKQLLTAGAGVLEVNIVRRHLSAVNGGRLAQKISATGAELVNLVLSDRVGDTSIGTPRVPVSYTGTQIGLDPSTFEQAWEILQRYKLTEIAPASVIAHIKNGPNLEETPKISLPGVSTFVIQGLEDSCTAAVKAAGTVEIPAHVLTASLEGDSRQAGIFLGSLAREIRTNNRPFTTPCLLIAAGETTVRITSSAGAGGPAQELGIAFAQQIAGLSGIAFAAIETEGTDGPTELAGALTDGTTIERANKLGFDPWTALDEHNARAFLVAINDHLFTGNTGTNLCDLNLIYIE